MNIEAQKMRFEQIEKSFSDLKKNRRKFDEISKIEGTLKEVFGQSFKISIIETKRNDPLFVMSVFPEMSTIDKIVSSIVNEEPVSVIYEIWKKNTSWLIEIDRRILDDTFAPISSKECTALLLHELGHIVDSNAVPNRISRVVKYEFAKIGKSIKLILKDDKFKRIFSLPVLDICSFSSREGLKKEFIADNFAKKMGYGEEINSVLGKLLDINEVDTVSSLKSSVKFSTDMIEDFRQRRANVSKSKLLSLSSFVPSPFVNKFLKETVSFYNDENKDGYFTEAKRQEIFYNAIDKIIDNYYTEFFTGKKKLKRLDEYDIDYISVEIDKMKTEDDKLLLLSYIRSKLDMAQYYIDILSNKDSNKKYEVPHTMEYVIAYKEKISQLHIICLKRKIEYTRPGYQIIYPKGYEG